MTKLEFSSAEANERTTLFVELILPIPIPRTFTYRVPFELNELIQLGIRVIAPLGARRILTGIVYRILDSPPGDYEAKYILEILEDSPSANSYQLRLFDWISSYYMCSLGEVLNTALPAGLKLSSESRVQLNPTYNYKTAAYPLSETEAKVIQALKNGQSLEYRSIADLTGLKNIYSLIKSLIRKEAVILFEEVKDRYKPKIEKRVRLTKEFTTNKALEGLFRQLEKKAKQTDVLLHYLRTVAVLEDPSLNDEGIEKSSFRNAALSESSLKTLMASGVFEPFEVVVSRFPEVATEMVDITLTQDQIDAKDNILKGWQEEKPIMLYGITGSGKTEIYIELISDVIENGYQALYLLPEIALTAQIVTRLQRVFGNKLGVYHSGFSDNERVEIWNGVKTGIFQFVVGVRSSIFLPFDNLGMIIVDEEHDNSYKQMDPAPRYHARDTALVLAKFHHAKVLLGSATPSVESYHHASTNNYQLVELPERFGASSLPEIEFADVRKEKKRKTMKGNFSSSLLSGVDRSLKNGEQVIIFQNRRGYAPFMSCGVCGWLSKCENCSVSLTYHLYRNELKCHYCGFTNRVPPSCPSCGASELETKYFGTEMLEEDLKLLFPDHRVRRMDFDTTRKKHSYKTIIEDFERGETDILVGTQMVSKGLDFSRVTLVGIFDADRMLHFPDFRAYERTFQLITQVSGRAGRREKPGRVIIQTYDPNQEVLRKIQDHNFTGFYQGEIQERAQYKYPPFYRLINITFRHKDFDICRRASKNYADTIQEELGADRILGPQEGIIARIRNQYIWEILIKLERNRVNLNAVKRVLKAHAVEIAEMKDYKNIQIIFDVDPQ